MPWRASVICPSVKMLKLVPNFVERYVATISPYNFFRFSNFGMKQNENLDLGGGGVVTRIWGNFDLLVFKVIWGHSVHVCPQMACNSKMAGRRANLSDVYWGTFPL